MKQKIFFAILAITILSGCEKQRYQIIQAEYSAWKNDEMHLRKKTIMLDTETGETWGLAYDKKTATEDGYGWEKIPKN